MYSVILDLLLPILVVVYLKRTPNGKHMEEPVIQARSGWETKILHSNDSTESTYMKSQIIFIKIYINPEKGTKNTIVESELGFKVFQITVFNIWAEK